MYIIDGQGAQLINDIEAVNTERAVGMVDLLNGEYRFGMVGLTQECMVGVVDCFGVAFPYCGVKVCDERVGQVQGQGVVQHLNVGGRYADTVHHVWQRRQHSGKLACERIGLNPYLRAVLSFAPPCMALDNVGLCGGHRKGLRVGVNTNNRPLFDLYHIEPVFGELWLQGNGSDTDIIMTKSESYGLCAFDITSHDPPGEVH